MPADGWTTGDVMRLVYLRRRVRMSQAEIADELGRSVGDVQAKLREINSAAYEGAMSEPTASDMPRTPRRSPSVPQTMRQRAIAIARDNLRREIELAKRERATSPPYKPPATWL